MPELPEVETIKNAVQKALKSAVILDVTVNNFHLRKPVPKNFALDVSGNKILGYRRIGKYVVIDLSNQKSLIIHLGMSGKIKLSDDRGKEEKHDHIVFRTSEGYMVYNDPRRFGLCLVAETDRLQQLDIFKNMGTDPFNEELTGDALYERIKKKAVSIKQVLLNQAVICGIGNIYASEALFLSNILPTRKACSLTNQECEVLVAKIRETLTQAIAAGGSTLRDYKKPDGSLGYFQNLHCVYNKTGQPCPNCTCNLQKTGGIQKIVQNGRSTYFCTTMQR